MSEPKVSIPDTERGEEVRVEVPVPDPNAPDPKGVVTTKRSTPIVRSDTDHMTTDSGRFKES